MNGLSGTGDERLTYSGYLHLDSVLAAQQPVAEPGCHDEMLFIVQHQVAELLMKLLIHELREACRLLDTNEGPSCVAVLDRIDRVLAHMVDQWSLLETLSPASFAEFRPALQNASGIQSAQYRIIEFLLGYKRPHVIRCFSPQPEMMALLREASEAPSIYDQFIRYLHRQGHGMPVTGRDGVLEEDDALVRAFRDAYAYGASDVRDLCDRMASVAGTFHLWRARHVQTVSRFIGRAAGTGGSSGVSFLNRTLQVRFFPELTSALNREPAEPAV
ncbi:tryptophan 2,3-dioxygenase [Streptomyces sp. NPDC053431]|uniref:tryptophan 2,3-dioxygenase n=1 Tax=Streptomyces sp. NPDC053431 TaxID=3365703 RepID=UPI0037D48A7C